MNQGADDLSRLTDHYFRRAREIVSRFGDKKVTYAVFLRRPCVAAHGLAVKWLQSVMDSQNQPLELDIRYNEGQWVGAGEPLLFFSGSYAHLSEVETLFLQKLGAPCVAAFNAAQMCVDLPNAAFIAMEARHCADVGMHRLMSYAAKVGSDAAKTRVAARGFIGSSTDLGAEFFGNTGLGTMPHALVGYAGSTLAAAQMFVSTYPNDDLTILPDYFGREITDTLEVCNAFPEMAEAGRIAVRLDTHGGRFCEGLDPQESYAVLERNAPKAIRGYRSESELRALVGTGVSAACIWHMREQLDKNRFNNVKIVASSGFGPAKCKLMADANAPIDVVGTGSFIPENWSETYATADIVSYDDQPMVKLGREFLLASLTKRTIPKS